MFRQLTKGSPSFADAFRKHTGTALTEDLGSSLLPAIPNDNLLFNEMNLRTRNPRAAAIIVELNKTAQSLAEVVYSDVQQHLAKTASASEYTVSKYEEDLENHLNAITFTIPPIESGDTLQNRSPSSLATIINVGWAAVLTRVDQIKVRPDPDHPKTGNLATIHNLLLKAVELSEAKRRWESA
jgi:hypothetical protein